MTKISLVIPLYNEEESIPFLFEKLKLLINQLSSYQVEAVLVDDGSGDRTFEKLSSNDLNCQVQIIRFSRNFGHQSALLAGLKASKGDYIITMDGDLQHPPELIPTFLEKHAQGFDIVFTKRIDSQGGASKNFTSHLFYKLINRISRVNIPENSSDFRSMSRASLDSLLMLDEKRIFLRGLVSWIGFNTTTIDYSPNHRVAGTSKYSWSKMTKLAIDAITSFSAAPMYLAGFSSLIFFVAALAYAIYVLIIKFYFNIAVSGWASVLFVLLILSSFISLFLALLGLYVSAIFDEVKRRPNYIIADHIIR